MLRRKNARHLRVLEARRGEEIALDRARFGAPISPEAIVTSTNHERPIRDQPQSAEAAALPEQNGIGPHARLRYFDPGTERPRYSGH